MPLIDENPAYTTLKNTLLQGMNNSSALSDGERGLTPNQYTMHGSGYQNVHFIPLDADPNTWNNGAWFILKPRFFYQIIKSKRAELNALITSLLELDNTVNISDEILHQSLVENTDNDTVFNVFIMLKIALEKLEDARPQQAHDFKSYQLMNPLQVLNSHEKELATSLWPGLTCKDLWQKSYEQNFDDITIVFNCLQQIMAQVVINSTLQGIALKTGLARNNLIAENHPQQRNGLCDLTARDLDTLSEFLCSLPATKTVYDWLVKHDSPLTRTISSLLGAILEKPKNVDHFLKALNLQQGTAKAKLDQIEREKVLTNEEIQARRVFTGEINTLMTEFSEKINGYENTKYYLPLTTLRTQLNGFLLQFNNRDINKETFKKQSISAIRLAQSLVREEPNWYNYLADLANKILNAFIGLVYNTKDHPHKFFKLKNDATNEINSVEDSLNKTCAKPPPH